MSDPSHLCCIQRAHTCVYMRQGLIEKHGAQLRKATLNEARDHNKPGRAFALCTADLGSTPGVPIWSPELFLSDPEHRAGNKP